MNEGVVDAGAMKQALALEPLQQHPRLGTVSGRKKV